MSKKKEKKYLIETLTFHSVFSLFFHKDFFGVIIIQFWSDTDRLFNYSNYFM